MIDPGPGSLVAASPRRIRQVNEIAALRALHLFGPLSRAELARRLALNRSSSGHIIAGLLGSGLVRERAATDRPGAARVGRPGIKFELVPDAVCFLGVEIGVEHITVAEIDLGARVVSHRVERFDGAAVGAEAAIERAVGLALGAVAPERLDSCEGLGISIPAQMDRNGFVRLAPLLRWRDVDVPEIARRVLPAAMPVVVENDANAFAIGATYGPARARSGVTLFIVLESGVGGGIVVDGSLYRGTHGLAGEIGHLLVPDGAGGHRALEAAIGLEAVLAGSGGRPLDAFLADVRDREPRSVAIAEGWSRSLAFALVEVGRVLDPGHVVVGGSLAALYPLVAARVASHMRALQEPSFPLPEIVTDDAFDCASAFGAACMLHQRFMSLDGQRLADYAPLAELPLDAPES